jgi:hypothetical protein
MTEAEFRHDMQSTSGLREKILSLPTVRMDTAEKFARALARLEGRRI